MISDDLDKLITESYKVIDEEIDELYYTLIKTSPVDTGKFKGSWGITKIPFKWTIHNPMEYAEELANGRRSIRGTMYGSLQWKDGITPYLQQFDKTLNRRLNELQY